MPMQTDSTLWVLSDGRKGHENQSLGVAEALSRRVPMRIAVKRLGLAPCAASLPAWLRWRHIGGRGQGAASVLAEGAEGLAPPWPVMVIGAGRRIAPITAWSRRHHGIRAVQLMEPHMQASAFDALVIPNHDLRPGRASPPNVIETIGAPNRLTSAAIAEAAGRLGPALETFQQPRLRIGRASCRERACSSVVAGA